MTIESLYDYCMSFKGVTESFPFDKVSLVLKVARKIFALIPLDNLGWRISVKCDPEKAVELREQYHCVKPAFHFNKKYWNTIYLNSDMNEEKIKYWICHSIDEVMKKIPKHIQNEYYQD